MADEPVGGGDDKALEDLETLDRAAGSTRSSPVSGPGSGPGVRGPALAAGARFGAYRLGALLGRGAFGQVWEAESLETGRRIALKVLHSSTEEVPEVLQRFEREGRLAASLNHPRCVYVLAADRIDGSPTIAMELMPGGTLADLLKRRGALPAAEAVDYALQLLDGLEAAHAAGILHRDLKPSNCFLDDGGEVKIGDFGLSRTRDLDSDLTEAGAFMGTPSYASPEQVRGRDLDFRSDLYSFGATLYALLCATPPFEGRQAGEILSRILTEEPPAFASHGVEVPKGLQAAVLRLLAKDPEKRWRDHASLRAALLPFSSRGLTAGSLTRRAGAFLADLIPFWILEAVLGIALLRPGVKTATLAPLQGLMAILLFLYFLLCEALWERSPGKALFGLRVASASGGPLRFRQTAVRTAVFVGLLRLEEMTRLVQWAFAVRPGFPLQFATELLIVAALIAIVAPMRRRNGFAGLHELASGTRVRFVRSRSALTVPSAALAAPAPEGSRAFGPYPVTGSVWQANGQEVLVARDPVLERSVWIHRVEDVALARPLTELAAHSPSRLRWLQGSRTADALWDAYEHPGGIGLAEWVERPGRLSWDEMRAVLLGVARALADEPEASSPPLSLSRVWIDGAGRVRLLHFAVSADEPEVASWRAFLHQLAIFGLEGRRLPETALDAAMPRAAVPEHARPFLQRLCGTGQPFESPRAVAEELEELAGRPARITRRLRAASLLLPMAPIVTVAGIALLALVLVQKFVSGSLGLMDLDTHLKMARELETAADPGAQDKRRAIKVILAEAYAALEVTGQREEILAELGPEAAAVLQAAHRDHPRPTPEEVRQARRTLGLPEKETVARIGGTRLTLGRDDDGQPLEVEVIRGLFGYLGFVGLLSVVVSPWLRGGLGLHLLGLTLQRSDGRRVGRVRALVRTVLAWVPFLCALGLSAADDNWSLLTVPGLLVVLGAAAGVVWAFAARSDRGLPDLLADTRLVPR